MLLDTSRFNSLFIIDCIVAVSTTHILGLDLAENLEQYSQKIFREDGREPGSDTGGDENGAARSFVIVSDGSTASGAVELDCG